MLPTTEPTTREIYFIGAGLLWCLFVLLAWAIWYRREHMAVIREFMRDCFPKEGEPDVRDPDDTDVPSRLSASVRPDADLSQMHDVRSGDRGLGRHARRPLATRGPRPRYSPFGTPANKGIKGGQ